VAAKPRPWDSDKIAEFCRDHPARQVAFVPSGGRIEPPKYFDIVNVKNGFRYDYDVVELDPGDKVRATVYFRNNNPLEIIERSTGLKDFQL
jgi:hypothetical protein